MNEANFCEIYGLQRTLKKTGVGTIVIALWSVSDKVATEFMTTFNEQLDSKQCQWSKHKAFEQAKSIIRDKYPELSGSICDAGLIFYFEWLLSKRFSHKQSKEQ